MRNPISNLPSRGFCIAHLLLVLCCSCSTTSLTDGRGAVRNVDCDAAVGIDNLAEHVREFGDETYPKICALLLDETIEHPKHFDVVVGPLKSRNGGETYLERKRIYLNSDYLTNNADGFKRFDQIFVHEMSHVAVLYQRWPERLWTRKGTAAELAWGESIADYARFKLIGTNGWRCPECNTRYPSYESGYTCGGAFLLYLDEYYGQNVVRSLARELHERSYRDEFFVRATGKTLGALWQEFQRSTSCIKPLAADAFKLQEALGYRNGVPPRNVVKRFKEYVNGHANDFTKKVLAQAKAGEPPFSDVRDLVTAYVYLMQPGGSAEEICKAMQEAGELPGISKGEKATLSTFLDLEKIESFDYPAVRTLDLRKPTDSSSTYHYVMRRDSEQSGWKLEKAWRADSQENVIQEYAVAQ